MKIVEDSPPILTALDRPNSYIGRSVPRPNLARLTQGRAQFVSDVTLPRMAHVAFVRSPHAHARIRRIDAAAAKQAPGVIAIVTGAELAKVITPWVGVLTHLKGIKSAPQHALAVDRACWQGEAVAAVVARTRAQAEDACELVQVDYEELPAVTDPETALDPGTPVIHSSLGDNLTFERIHTAGDPDQGFKSADAVIETTFVFGRHTGVCNEPRAVVADWNPGEQRMTVYHGTQAPHMMQNLFAKHLALEEHQVRVITKDVGGSFGIKVHTYADEMATVALSKLLRRPIKFVADRIESFVTDIHARDHRVKAKIGVRNDGTITAWEIDDLTGIGPYSVYPRTSGIEANQIVNLTGGPYTCPNYRARARVVFQNKNVMCQYRAVGHPDRDRGDGRPGRARGREDRHGSAGNPAQEPDPGRCASIGRPIGHQVRGAVAPRLPRPSRRHDELRGPARRAGAAARAGHPPRHRLRELHRGDQSERRLLRRRRRAHLRAGRRHRPPRCHRRDLLPHRRHRAGPGRGGRGGAMRRDRLRRCRSSACASSPAIPTTRPMAAAPGPRAPPASAAKPPGRPARRCGRTCSRSPAAFCRRSPKRSTSGTASSSITTPARSASASTRSRASPISVPIRCPPACRPSWWPRGTMFRAAWAFSFTNGIQASYLEVDTDSGFVKLLKHWCIEDCGTVINPQLVDEQVRGGVVQGLGGALFEHCLYDERGQLLNGNMADYLVPMAMEMPDIEVGHVVTPTANSELGAKGAGEAGTAGAPGAVMNAINDALRPLGAQPVTEMPFTPGKILEALGKV